jgi:AcrR family transcriptional regulator
MPYCNNHRDKLVVVASTDQVQKRPGGRSAEVRKRVFAAMREALESGNPEELAIERLAERSGVHRATIYRRWFSTEGLVTDLLVELTPIDTPLPDTGALRGDLAELIERVARTIAAPSTNAMLRLVAATTDDQLAEAASRYWMSLIDHTADVIRLAQQRGEATTAVDAVAATESLLAPLYLRLLVTHHPITDAFLANVVDRTVRLLQR